MRHPSPANLRALSRANALFFLLSLAQEFALCAITCTVREFALRAITRTGLLFTGLLLPGLICARRAHYARGRAHTDPVRAAARSHAHEVFTDLILGRGVVGGHWDGTDVEADARLRQQVMASVKIHPRKILSTPGTSGYRLSCKGVLRAVPHKPLRSGIF